MSGLGVKMAQGEMNPLYGGHHDFQSSNLLMDMFDGIEGGWLKTPSEDMWLLEEVTTELWEGRTMLREGENIVDRPDLLSFAPIGCVIARRESSCFREYQRNQSNGQWNHRWICTSS